MAIEGFKIATYDEVVNELSKYRDNYNEKGVYLGFNNIEPYYSMMLGTCTDWTGFPSSGKTQVLMEMLINTSLFYQWKHLVYFPDIGSTIEIIADLVHKKTHKSFNPKHPNVITDEEIQRATIWVTSYFHVLTKENVKAKMTPFQFWDFAVELKNSKGLHTASIDSWKDMNHPYSEFGGYATYLEAVLPYRNQIAEDHNLHLHTIIHPKLTEKENGKRNPPTPYDLKGGSEWFNSGKCMITVHRQDSDTTNAEIYVNKIKPRACGKVGNTNLIFDVMSLRYYEFDGNNPNIRHFAREKGGDNSRKVEPDMKAHEFNTNKNILPNSGFDDSIPF